MSNQTKVAKVEVELARPHTHRGKAYPADHKIEVTETERNWLARHNIIKTDAPVASKGKG